MGVGFSTPGRQRLPGPGAPLWAQCGVSETQGMPGPRWEAHGPPDTQAVPWSSPGHPYSGSVQLLDLGCWWDEGSRAPLLYGHPRPLPPGSE